MGKPRRTENFRSRTKSLGMWIILTLLSIFVMAIAQDDTQLFTDEESGPFIDFISERVSFFLFQFLEKKKDEKQEALRERRHLHVCDLRH